MKKKKQTIEKNTYWVVLIGTTEGDEVTETIKVRAVNPNLAADEAYAESTEIETLEEAQVFSDEKLINKVYTVIY